MIQDHPLIEDQSAIMSPMPEVWIVDDDVAVATLASRVLESVGEFACRQFTSASALLAELKNTRPACIVSDIKMPEVDGKALQQQLLEFDPTICTVFLTGYADVPTTVLLMEQGAVTLLQKPYEAADLIAAVRKAVRRCDVQRRQHDEAVAAQARLERLSEDEREVLECMVAGLSNKAIAFKLALSPRTLDRRRQTILQTMEVESVVELAALVERLRTHRA